MTMEAQVPVSVTVFDAIVASVLRAARFNPDDQVAPTVILWTDNDRQWEPLLPRIQERLPQLLVLGNYEADKRSGRPSASGAGRRTASTPRRKEPWPQDNERLEAELREALVRVGDKSETKAREAIGVLEDRHKDRRGF